MTALVKGSVTQGHTPPPPEAHVIKYASGGAVELELYGRSFSRYFSKLGSIFKKALHLKPLNSRLPCFETKPSSKSVSDRHRTEK